jgi:hypothetical protein
MIELMIPPMAQEDPNSFEILRVWAANNEQHVTIHSNLNGNACDFGYLIAQLVIHGAKLYAQRNNRLEEDMLKEILQGFNDEIKYNSGNATGSIPE